MGSMRKFLPPRRVAAIFFIPLALLCFITPLAFAQAAIQNPSAEAQIEGIRRELESLKGELSEIKSEELGERLAELQTRLDEVDKNIENSVSTLAQTSSNTISAMSWFLYIAGAVIAAIIGVASYFGYRRIQDIGRSYEAEFENTIDEVNAAVAQSESRAGEVEARLIESGNKYDGELKRAIEEIDNTHTLSKINLKEAENLLSKLKKTDEIQKSWMLYRIILRYVDELGAYDSGLKRIDDIISKGISDNLALSSFYGIKGYILGLKNRNEEALRCTNIAYDLLEESRGDNLFIVYNSACFASLLGRRHEAMDRLDELLREMPEWKGEIVKLKDAAKGIYELRDKDLGNLKDEPRFKRILGISDDGTIEI
ncbi:MAG: hypothetical protein ACT4NX_09770 [Deltaproteobacteria bacterium]